MFHITTHMQQKMSVASIFFLCLTLLCTGCTSQKVIVNGVEEREANEILVYLQGKGIDASKVLIIESGAAGGKGVPMFDVNVPASRSTEAMALLNMAGLPRRSGHSLLKIFQGGGLVPSQLEEKVRYQQGLAQQISTTIRKIDGVIEADVLPSFPEEDPLNPEKNKDKVSASVYVKHTGVLDDPNENLSSKIRRLVASSIPGLEYDQVTVISDRARFSDSAVTAATRNQDKLVKVWGLQMNRDSVWTFQIVFVTLIAFLLLFLALLCFALYRVQPILEPYGGMVALFSLSPLLLPPQEDTKESEQLSTEDDEDFDEFEEDDEDDEDDEDEE